MSRDPRELEMLAIINMQPHPDEVALIKGIDLLETSTTTTTSTASIADDSDQNPDNDDGILKPGTKIRPVMDAEDARKLAERLYGIVASEIKELVSFDDRNFLIKADR